MHPDDIARLITEDPDEYVKLKTILESKDQFGTVLVDELVPELKGYEVAVKIAEEDASNFKKFFAKFGKPIRYLGAGAEGAAFKVGPNTTIKHYVQILPEMYEDEYDKSENFQVNISPYEILLKHPRIGFVDVFNVLKSKHNTIYSFALVAMEFLEDTEVGSGYIEELSEYGHEGPSIEYQKQYLNDISIFMKTKNIDYPYKSDIVVNRLRKPILLQRLADATVSADPKRFYSYFPKEMGYSKKQKMWVRYDLIM